MKSEWNSPPDPQACAQPAPYETEAQSEILPSADVALVIAFITQLRRVFSAPSYRPPLLPTVALEVHQLSLRSDVGADQLVQVLEKDAVLAGQVLRVAGSAAFGGWGQKDVSLKIAVVRLGMRNLASVVWEVAAGMRVFRSPRYAAAMEQIRSHSTLCAHLCRLIAARRSLSPETAFLCGLLHDIGMAAALIVLGEQKATTNGLDPTLLGMALQQCHQEASAVVAGLWKLPPDVRLVLGHHHDVVIHGFVHPLAAVVAVAEELTREAGLGIVLSGHNCDVTSDTALAHARNALGFDRGRMEKLGQEAKRLLSTLDRGAATAAATPDEHPKAQRSKR